ncbi:MAG: small subunit ribosomal protein S8 [archaeon GW2011_AR18]|nr:small subunit ribosomal protein S8 [uncultured archaeon]KHO54247.1 MAG: small subunit ribosomal protein S8 [archaeon GW2011_AR18]
MNDPISNALTTILNAEKKGKSTCIIKPFSNLVVSILELMKTNGYITEFNSASNARGGSILVKLNKNINECGVVKPRFSFTKKNYEMFEKRYLPAKGLGFFVVTTSKGVMTHKEALDKGVGGKLIAYCY